MKNRLSKLYYTSGMISLILIPLLGYWIIDRQVKQKSNQRCIEISVCSKDTTCSSCLRCKPPDRIYKTIYITGDKIEDTKNLTLIDAIADSYYTNEDTVNGLEIEFLDNAKYGTLIKILDICKIRHISHYVINDNHLWLLFDFVDLRIGDINYKTKYLGFRRRLLKGADYDYEILIKDKLHSNWNCYTDMVIFDEEIENPQKKQLCDYIYERRFLLGILTLIYITMIILSIARLIRKNK